MIGVGKHERAVPAFFFCQYTNTNLKIFIGLITMGTLLLFLNAFKVNSGIGGNVHVQKIRKELSTRIRSSKTPLTEELATSTLYSPVEPSKEDIECIENRQLLHKVTPFGVSQKPCKHGFPQAFAYHPSKHKFNTNLFRLTCPKLVQAVDEYEKGDDQTIVKMNERLATDPSFKQTLSKINADHSTIRKEVMGADEIKRMEDVMGKELADIMLASGITGMSPTVLHDVKCLHAHLADYLCRGAKANPIGAEVYQGLQQKGIEVDGCSQCQHQCDATLGPIDQAAWIYLPQKNHQKLRQKAQRRKIIKQNIQKKKNAESLQHVHHHGNLSTDSFAGSVERSNLVYRDVLSSPIFSPPSDKNQ